jgi:uncharacterized protein (DUF1330 family)
MPAYVIAQVEVTDMMKYREYMKATPESIKRYGGKFIARGGTPVTLEGKAENRRVVILEFENTEKANAWYNSAEYQDAKKLREGAANASFVIVEGVNL